MMKDSEEIRLWKEKVEGHVSPGKTAYLGKLIQVQRLHLLPFSTYITSTAMFPGATTLQSEAIYCVI